MFPAFLATLLFSVSVIAASRSAQSLGSNSANFWRVVVATVLLGAWAHLVGLGLGGGALGWFFFSGCVGFGLGDMALFQALPRLGPRLSSLLINCLAAPFAAALEWVWLGTRLTPVQVACGVAILAGVGLALAPEHHLPIPARRRWVGIAFGTLAGLGQAYGAVLSRKAFALAAAAGQHVDGGTAAYQRILGGLAVVAVPYLWLILRERLGPPRPEPRPAQSPADRSRARRWVAINALAGPTIGVACYQWALRVAPSGVVLPVTAPTPLAVIPFTYYLDRDRPGGRSLLGGLLAVAGVVGLTLL